MPPLNGFVLFKKTKLIISGLIILTTLFLTGFVLIYINTHSQLVVELQKKELKFLADNFASDHEGSIFGIRQFLITSSYLAENLDIRENKCDQILQRMYVVYPYFLNIGITDKDGNVICSGIDLGRLINLAGDTDFQEAKNTKSFTVSGYKISTYTGRPSVRFIQPIIKGKEFSGVIFVTFATEWLNGFSSSLDLPEGTVVTKFDANGVVFMRFPDPLTWSGTDQSDSELFKSIKANKSGFFSVNGLAGKKRMYYFRPIYNDGKINAYIAVGSSNLVD